MEVNFRMINFSSWKKDDIFDINDQIKAVVVNRGLLEITMTVLLI